MVDGKPYKKPESKVVKKITDYLKSLPYGKAVTIETIAKRFNYKSGKNGSDAVSFAFRRHRSSNVELYRYRLSYHLMLWANPKTIRDLKNGKFKL